MICGRTAPPAQMLTSAIPCDAAKSQVATGEMGVYGSFRQRSLKEASSVQCSCRRHEQRGQLLGERLYLPGVLYYDA